MFPKQTEGTIPLEGHVTQRCVQGPDALHVNVTASVTPADIQIQQRAVVCVAADARVYQSRKSSPSFGGTNASKVPELSGTEDFKKTKKVCLVKKMIEEAKRPHGRGEGPE